MSTIEINPIQDVDSWKTRKAIDVKSQLESLLFASGSLVITNKIRRQIKKLFNEQINLTDKMFQGFHTDGSIIGTLGDDVKEVDMLYHILKKTPSLSFAKAEKTIKKWMSDALRTAHLDADTGTNEPRAPFNNARCRRIARESEPKTESKPQVLFYPTKKHELIAGAYSKYMEEVKSKKVQVKTRGLDFVSKCFDYWNSENVDPVLEEQINKACDDLNTMVISSFDDEFTFEDFANSLVLVLDISGSMAGTPLNTGLFYMLMMVKVFGVQTLYYFESELEVRTISPGWVTNLDLINQVYSDSKGSTNLDSVFKHLDDIKTCNKNIIIVSDGDCDPSDFHSSNPFHEVTREDKETSSYPNVADNNYVVVNVKQEKMNFPFLGLDPKVCYLTGNNPKTLNGFIKALCESTKSGIAITPEHVLKYTLNMDELEFQSPIPSFSFTMTDERIGQLFEVFKKNLPPKKPVVADTTADTTTYTTSYSLIKQVFMPDMADAADNSDADDNSDPDDNSEPDDNSYNSEEGDNVEPIMQFA